MRLHIIFVALLACSSAMAGGQNLIYEKYVPGITGYGHLDPIVDNSGAYAGFIGTDGLNDVLDVWDSDGNLLLSIDTPDDPLKTINRYSPDDDTLYIYTLMDRQGEWGSWEAPFTVGLFALSNDTVTFIDSLSPECYHYPIDYNAMPYSGPKGQNIRFEYGVDNKPVCVSFHVRTLYGENNTAGPTFEDIISTFKIYNLDLSEELFTGMYDLCLHDDLNEDSLADYAYFKNYYHMYYHDWFDVTVNQGTSFGICLKDSRTYYRNTKTGSAVSRAMFTGDFIKNRANNEVIYYGEAVDLLGNYVDTNYHIACYSATDSVVKEEWYTLTDAFSPHIYDRHNNLLVGMIGGRKVAFLDCANGTPVNTVQFDRMLCNICFYYGGQSSTPRLFTTSGDTIKIYSFEGSTDVADSDNSNLRQTSFRMDQNYPNPFNSTTVIEYSLPVRSHVAISIYNLLGQKLTTLINEVRAAGDHRAIWNGEDSDGKQVSSGVYFYHLKAGDYGETRKMVLTK